MEKLAASGLLEKREATITTKSGTERVLGSYIGVNEERLADLSDDQFLELRHNDLLPFIYMHLTSISNWMRLLDLHVLRNPPSSMAPSGPESGTATPAGP